MKAFCLTTVLILVATTVQAQGIPGINGQSTSRSAAAPQVFELKVTEFRLAHADTREMNTEQILELYQQADDGQMEVVHTLHLRAISGHAVHVETVEDAPDSLGEEITGKAAARGTLGATAAATIHWLTDRAVVDLSYDGSHVLADVPSESTEERPPRITRLRLTTTLVAEANKTTILGGGKGAFTSYLAVVLSKLP